jgi:hypothetical protein
VNLFTCIEKVQTAFLHPKITFNPKERLNSIRTQTLFWVKQFVENFLVVRFSFEPPFELRELFGGYGSQPFEG